MGYGTVQLKHITELLQWLGFSKALARTGDIEFFAPARRLNEQNYIQAAARLPGFLIPDPVVHR